MAELSPGAVLGERFELLGAVGRGGMATVYLALDRVRGERVALKVLHGHLASDPSMRARLRREVAAAALLRHPQALTAFDLHDLDGTLALSMPYHSGRTLAEHVAIEGPLEVDQVRRLGTRLAEVLGEAHRAGLLHRDLSPRNVMLDDRGSPVLMDFGLAKLADGRTAASTQVLGTAGFAAPEVLEGVRADPRSDLYGLGAVLYVAATGQAPFAGAHPAAVLRHQLEGPCPDPRSLRPEVPEWLGETIQALMDPDPGARPEGAAEVIEALERGRAPDGPAKQEVGGKAAREAPAAGGELALPGGAWAVRVEERDEQRMRRRSLRLRARNQEPDAETTFYAAATGVLKAVQKAVGLPADGRSPEAVLAAAVAREAGRDAESAEVPAAMMEKCFRLVDGVDRDAARRLARVAEEAGFKAQVVRSSERQDTAAFLARRWWAAIPAMWVIYPMVMAMGAPGEAVFLFVLATVLLATVVGPWVRHVYGPGDLESLPLAFRGGVGREEAVTPQSAEEVEPGEEGDTAAEAPTRVDRLRVRAEEELDRFDAAIAARTEELPRLALTDLRGTVGELRTQLAGLAATAEELDGALARGDTAATDGWAAERLERLQALERAGESVDVEERDRLERAVAARREEDAAVAGLESRLTATLAQILEIAAIAGRGRRELQSDALVEQSVARLGELLAAQVQAARKARRELG